MKRFFYMVNTDNGMKDVIVKTEEMEGQEPLMVSDTDNEVIINMHQKRLYNKVNNIKPEVKKLEDRFGRFKKVDEGNKYYIYLNTGTMCYEVFDKKVKHNREIYPTDEDFGDWAWCYHKLEDATRHAKALED